MVDTTAGIWEVLKETTRQFRKQKAEVVDTHGGAVRHIYDMPHVDEAEGLELVDVHFVMVGVDKAAAEEHVAGLAELMAGYPDLDELAKGPGYITLGAWLGDQGAALCLMALGEVLGMWHLITPAKLHIDDEALADQMAGAGWVLISGWSPERPRPYVVGGLSGG